MLRKRRERKYQRNIQKDSREKHGININKGRWIDIQVKLKEREEKENMREM